jgi:hypothetical protein
MERWEREMGKNYTEKRIGDDEDKVRVSEFERRKKEGRKEGRRS